VKSVVKIQPLNNGSVNSTQSIIFQLPQDAILDLSTLEFSAVVKLPHNGAVLGSPQNYYQGKYLPRNGLASLISSIDIQINGKSISNIVSYSYLYNLIKDWVLGKDLSNCAGEMRDPSSFHGSHPGGGKCDRLLKKKNPLRQSQGGPGPARRAQWSLHFVHNLCLV
jgi:hypothetical protein